MSGYSIGILLLDVWYPLLPGNVANAYTFDFPVRHKLIKGAVQECIVHNDRSIFKEILKASKELELEGVKAICGACGYLGNFQKQLSEKIETPVFLSSLLQVPLIKAGLKKEQKIGAFLFQEITIKQSIPGLTLSMSIKLLLDLDTTEGPGKSGGQLMFM